MLKGGWTTLHKAAFKGSEQIVKILLEHESMFIFKPEFSFFFFLILILVFVCFFSFLLFGYYGVQLLGLFHVALCGCVVYYLFCFCSFCFNNFLLLDATSNLIKINLVSSKLSRHCHILLKHCNAFFFFLRFRHQVPFIRVKKPSLGWKRGGKKGGGEGR